MLCYTTTPDIEQSIDTLLFAIRKMEEGKKVRLIGDVLDRERLAFALAECKRSYLARVEIRSESVAGAYKYPAKGSRLDVHFCDDVKGFAYDISRKGRTSKNGSSGKRCVIVYRNKDENPDAIFMPGIGYTISF